MNNKWAEAFMVVGIWLATAIMVWAIVSNKDRVCTAQTLFATVKVRAGFEPAFSYFPVK